MHTTRPTLELLLERFRQGNHAAREEFFTLLMTDKRYHAVLFAMARRALRDARIRRVLDSQDLVQSAIRTSLDKFPEFRGETARVFFGWLRRILERKIYRVTRQERQRLEPRRLEPTQFRIDDEESHGLAVNIDDREACDDLREAIEGLPRDDRRIVELRLTGKTSKEIGGMLTLKPAAVRKRLSRTVRRLKRALVERPEDVGAAPSVFSAPRSASALSASG